MFSEKISNITITLVIILNQTRYMCCQCGSRIVDLDLTTRLT